MPWEHFSFASLPPLLLVALLAGTVGFVVGALWRRYRRRQEQAGPWELAAQHQGLDALAPEEDWPGLFHDQPSLRPTAPRRPTAAESALWQRAFERLLNLLSILKGDHKALRMVVWFPTEAPQRWRARLGFHLPVEDVHFVLNLDDYPDLRSWLLEHEQAYVMPLGAAASLRSWDALHHCRSAFWVPIRYFHRVDRLVLLVHPHPGYFQSHRVRLVTTALAMAALEGARLWYEDLLQRIKTQWVQWEKRLYRRLARQLHDGPAQTVAALAMEAGYLRLKSKRNPQEVLDDLSRLETLAREAAQEIRHLLFILRPVILEEEGLAAALHDLAAKMHRLYRQQVILELSPEVLERVHPSVQTVLFYIAVEGLNNAAKHAQADTVWVRLRPDPQGERLILEIEDNGKGFDPQQVLQNYTRRESLGLLTLQERVRRLGGRLEIDAAPGKGTRLVVYAPYTLQSDNAGEEDEDEADGDAAEAPARPQPPTAEPAPAKGRAAGQAPAPADAAQAPPSGEADADRGAGHIA